MQILKLYPTSVAKEDKQEGGATFPNDVLREASHSTPQAVRRFRLVKLTSPIDAFKLSRKR